MPFRKPELGEALFYTWSIEGEGKTVSYPCEVAEVDEVAELFKLFYFTSSKKNKKILEEEPVQLTQAHQKLEKAQLVDEGDWCYRQEKVSKDEKNFKRYTPPEINAIIPYAAPLGDRAIAAKKKNNYSSVGAALAESSGDPPPSLSFLTADKLPQQFLKVWHEHLAKDVYAMVRSCVDEVKREQSDKLSALRTMILNVQEHTDVRVENTVMRHMGLSIGFPIVKMTRNDAAGDDNGCVCKKFVLYTDNDPTRPAIVCNTPVAKNKTGSIIQPQNAPFQLHSANMYKAHIDGLRNCNLSDIYKYGKDNKTVVAHSNNPMRSYAMCLGCLNNFGASSATTAAVRTDYHNCLLCAINGSKSKGSIDVMNNDACAKLCRDCNASVTANQIGDVAFFKKGIVGYFKNVMGVDVEILTEIPVKGPDAYLLACDYCFKFNGQNGSCIIVFVENDFKAHAGSNLDKERDKTLRNFRTMTDMADARGACRMLIRVNFEQTPMLKIVMLREILAAMVRDQASFHKRGSILYLFYDPDNRFVVKHIAPWCVLNKPCAFLLGDNRPNWSSDPNSALFLHGTPKPTSDTLIHVENAFKHPVAMPDDHTSNKRKRSSSEEEE